MNKSVLIVVFIPLIFGFLIYTGFREDTLMFDILSFLCNDSFVIKYRSFLTTYFEFDSHFVDCLPSGLWVFSASIVSSRVYLKKRWHWYLFLNIPILYSIALEYFQWAGVTDGTYDQLDIISSIIAWVMALMVAKWIDINTLRRPISVGYPLFLYAILVLGNAF